jgi:hypothetical protein
MAGHLRWSVPNLLIHRFACENARPFVFSCAVASALVACNDCDQSGCEALKHHAEDAGTAVAGAIIYMDDVVDNGCLACPLSSASIHVWEVDEPIDSDEAAQAIASDRDADVMLEADEHYVLELDPGYYLFCAHPSLCTSIEVTEGETLTVHPAWGVPFSYTVGRPEEELEEVPTFHLDEPIE